MGKSLNQSWIFGSFDSLSNVLSHDISDIFFADFCVFARTANLMEGSHKDARLAQRTQIELRINLRLRPRFSFCGRHTELLRRYADSRCSDTGFLPNRVLSQLPWDRDFAQESARLPYPYPACNTHTAGRVAPTTLPGPDANHRLPPSLRW